MDAEAFARCGLARGRRTGNKDEFHGLASRYLIGYLTDFLLLQRLGEIDEVSRMSFSNSLVEHSHGAYSEDILPLMVLSEYLKHLVLAYHLAQLCRV